MDDITIAIFLLTAGFLFSWYTIGVQIDTAQAVTAWGLVMTTQRTMAIIYLIATGAILVALYFWLGIFAPISWAAGYLLLSALSAEAFESVTGSNCVDH